MKKALSVLRVFLFLFISAAGIAAAQEPSATPTAAAQDPNQPIPELSSPRSTVDNFFKYIDKFAAGDKKAIEGAIRCLDLSEIPQFSRREQGESLALKLHAILIRTKIERSKLPESYEGEEFTLRSDEKGEIILEKTGANWRFSKHTLREIPEFFFQVKDERILRSGPAAVTEDFDIYSLRKYVPSSLKGHLFSVEYWQLLGLIVAFIAAWLVKLICFRIFLPLIQLIVKRAQVLSQIKSAERFVQPLAYIAAIYVFHYAIFLLDLDPVIYTRFLRVLNVFKILAFFLVLLRLIDLIAEILKLRPKAIFGSSDDILIPLIRTAVKFVLAFLGIVLIAELYSVNLTGLIAGLGIGGLALALAAKDTVENLFGSITVLLDRPFNVGDFISIEGVMGSVENIGIRSTRLRTPENSLLTIPNSKLTSAIVDNLGARRFFRTRVSIGIVYETSAEKLELFCQSIREILKNHPMVRSDFIVRFNEFADSSLNILLQVHFQAASYSDYLAKQEELFLNIFRIASELGVQFAYPVKRQVADTEEDIKFRQKEVDQEALKKLLKDLPKKA